MIRTGFLTICGATVLVFNATAITITSGNTPGGSNVLFNDATDVSTASGTLGASSVHFTSSSGSGLLTVKGGQASLTGGTLNTLTNLKFFIPSETFTQAVFNIKSDDNGMVDFIVSYLNDVGSPAKFTESVSKNGQNFFTLAVSGAEKITLIEFGSDQVVFESVDQFRIAGNAPLDARTPDASSTVSLLGLGLMALGAIRTRICA